MNKKTCLCLFVLLLACNVLHAQSKSDLLQGCYNLIDKYNVGPLTTGDREVACDCVVQQVEFHGTRAAIEEREYGPVLDLKASRDFRKKGIDHTCLSNISFHPDHFYAGEFGPEHGFIIEAIEGEARPLTEGMHSLLWAKSTFLSKAITERLEMRLEIYGLSYSEEAKRKQEMRLMALRYNDELRNDPLFSDILSSESAILSCNYVASIRPSAYTTEFYWNPAVIPGDADSLAFAFGADHPIYDIAYHPEGCPVWKPGSLEQRNAKQKSSACFKLKENSTNGPSEKDICLAIEQELSDFDDQVERAKVECMQSANTSLGNRRACTAIQGGSPQYVIQSLEKDSCAFSASENAHVCTFVVHYQAQNPFSFAREFEEGKTSEVFVQVGNNWKLKNSFFGRF